MVLAEKYKKPSDGTGCRLEILLWLTNSVQRPWSPRGDPSNPADDSWVALTAGTSWPAKVTHVRWKWQQRVERRGTLIASYQCVDFPHR